MMLEATWLAPQPAMGARLTSLKSARYGKGELIFLLWGESMGSGRSASAPMYFTMVIAAAPCVSRRPRSMRSSQSAQATTS
jgi:hypothetical protein